MGIRLQFIRYNDRQYRVELFSDGDSQSVGFLPCLPTQLLQGLESWRENYRNLVSDQSLIAGIASVHGDVRETQNCYDQLIIELNRWIEGASELNPIRSELANLSGRLVNLHRNNQEFQIVLSFDCGQDDLALKQLPWRKWTHLEKYYPNSEVTLSALWENRNSPHPHSSKIRILYVLGQNIDAGYINERSLHHLFDLPNRFPNQVEIKILSAEEENLSVQSLQEELVDRNGYHILICIVHSRSSFDGNTAYFQLARNQELNINSFYQTLNIAVQNGLKLAILDSCANYGAASRFARSGLYYFLLMKELIPVDAAAVLLNKFFKSLSEGHSLLQSVHEARTTLEGFPQYPGVADLPMVYIKPNVEPLTWGALLENLIEPIGPDPVLFTSAQLCAQAQTAYQQWSISRQSDALEDAISNYTEAINQNDGWDSSPDGCNLAKAYYGRGSCYDSQGNSQGAIEDYNQAIENNSNYADAYFSRGLLRQADNRRVALADFRRARDWYPQGSEGRRRAEEKIRELTWPLFIRNLVNWIRRPRNLILSIVSILAALFIVYTILEGSGLIEGGNQLPPISPEPILERVISDLSSRSPRTVIDINNKVVAGLVDNNNILQIAAVVPGGDDSPDEETLRGIAQAQSEFNCSSVDSFLESEKGSKLDQCQGRQGKFLTVKITAYNGEEDLTSTVDSLKSLPIMGVVGRYTSKDLMQVAGVYERNGLILVTTTSNAERARLDLNDYIYRVVPDATAVAERLKDKFGQEKIEIIRNINPGDDTAYAGSLTSEVELLLQTFVNREDFCNLGGDKFNAVDCVKSISGDVVFLIPNLKPDQEIQDALKLIEEIGRSRPDIKVVGSDTLYDGRLIESGKFGRISERLGILILVPWARNPEDKTLFEQGALKLWNGGLINWRTAMAYDATKVLIQGLKDNPTRDGLRNVLSNNFILSEQQDTTATGRIEFENRDRKPYRQVFVEVKQDPRKRDPNGNMGYNFFRQD